MLRSHSVWLVPVALTLVGFGTSAAPATAQTTYPLSANYDITATADVLTPSLQQISLSGSSADAQYGLTQVSSLAYSQTNFLTGLFSFNTDPTTFGLQGLPSGSISFFGSGSDRLFGTESGTGLIDFANGIFTVTSSGIVNLTGGEGKFRGATGTLTFSQVQPLSLQPGVALTGTASVNGSFQIAVPEPSTSTTLLGMGAIAAGVLLCRRSRSKIVFK